MNRGSAVLFVPHVVQRPRFNEAPIHESGKYPTGDPKIDPQERLQ